MTPPKTGLSEQNLQCCVVPGLSPKITVLMLYFLTMVTPTKLREEAYRPLAMTAMVFKDFESAPFKFCAKIPGEAW
jgi:hypothetical protein